MLSEHHILERGQRLAYRLFVMVVGVRDTAVLALVAEDVKLPPLLDLVL